MKLRVELLNSVFCCGLLLFSEKDIVTKSFYDFPYKREQQRDLNPDSMIQSHVSLQITPRVPLV
jgi:hypothetical protein